MRGRCRSRGQSLTMPGDRNGGASGPCARVKAFSTSRPTCRARARSPGARAGDQALLQRDAVRALPARRRGLSSRPPRRCRATPTARRGPCARRSPSFTGSTRPASSAAPAPTSCSTCSPAPISARATRRSIAEHGFLVYKHRHPGARRDARRRAGDATSPPTSTRSSLA